MCYLVRQQQLDAESAGTALPARPGNLRPRWVGALGATLIAGLAMAAALVVPPSAPSHLDARETAAPAARVSTQALVPTAGGVQQTALPADDGVPTAPDTARVGAGPCHHGL
jgi:hypothetical protein